MQNVGESTGSIFKILGSGKQIMKKKNIRTKNNENNKLGLNCITYKQIKCNNKQCLQFSFWLILQLLRCFYITKNTFFFGFHLNIESRGFDDAREGYRWTNEESDSTDCRSPLELVYLCRTHMY